jgi:hypothetical protein
MKMKLRNIKVYLGKALEYTVIGITAYLLYLLNFLLFFLFVFQTHSR